jgi:hypothetical protein
MINDGINDVPEKTIAVFPDHVNSVITKEGINNVLKKSQKKREWFTPHFYRCLPLTIGNQYGFTISSEFDIQFVWNGGDTQNDIRFTVFEDLENPVKYPSVDSHFGSGIITVSTPFTLRTPPGINLMTINPPNVILPNITVMTGVVEADNLRRNFSFNLKIQIPNLEVFIPKGTPLAAFIPIPRYYADEFEVKFADEIFDEDTINGELQASTDAGIQREEIELKSKNQVGRDYFLGKDVYKNNFKDHQKP